jgi:hypothetical protein
MSRLSHTFGAFAAVAVLSVGVAACSDATDATVQAKKAGVDISNNGKSLPASFPKADVPLPKLKLGSAVGAPNGSFVMRYTSTDAQTDSDAYKSALTAAGFTVAGEHATPAQAALPADIAFVATSAKYVVAVSTFGPGQADGNYMGVTVK